MSKQDSPPALPQEARCPQCIQSRGDTPISGVPPGHDQRVPPPFPPPTEPTTGLWTGPVTGLWGTPPSPQTGSRTGPATILRGTPLPPPPPHITEKHL